MDNYMAHLSVRTINQGTDIGPRRGANRAIMALDAEGAKTPQSTENVEKPKTVFR